MKILHYISGLRRDLGGTVTSVVNLCEVLAADGHEVSVVTREASTRPTEWAGVDVSQRQIDSGWMSLRGPLSSSFIRTFDVIHVHSVWDPVAVRLAGAARKARVPYVVSPRGTLDTWALRHRALRKQLQLILAGRRLLARASVVHFTAEGEKRQAEAVAGIRRSAVVPNIVDLTAASQPATRNGTKVLFLSRLHPKKGAAELLRAVPAIAAASQGLQVVLAGPDEAGYQATLQGLADELGVSPIVLFPGEVTGAAKAQLFAEADVFVLPSHSENFGHVIFEALAAGLPVVTTRNVDLWPELEGSGGVRLTELAPSAIAGTLIGLLSDAALRRSMGTEGRTWVQRFLDRDRLSAEYATMYATAVSNGDDAQANRAAP